jgi:exonuclease III
LIQGICSPSYSPNDNIGGKTNELSGNKAIKASVTRKCLNKGFKIAQLNIRSILNNIDEFRMYALKHEYDVVCVNETWLDNSVNNHEIDLDGYDLIRKDRNRHGGGVAMFIRNTINYKIRSDIMPENLETITVEITKPKAKPFLLSTWYRPPNMPVNIFIDYELIIQKMDHENKEIICIGDFNCDWLSPEK